MDSPNLGFPVSNWRGYIKLPCWLVVKLSNQPQRSQPLSQLASSRYCLMNYTDAIHLHSRSRIRGKQLRQSWNESLLLK